eukprot:Trichotokara_eunicae@DN89_c0_g1_i1.p1
MSHKDTNGGTQYHEPYSIRSQNYGGLEPVLRSQYYDQYQSEGRPIQFDVVRRPTHQGIGGSEGWTKVGEVCFPVKETVIVPKKQPPLVPAKTPPVVAEPAAAEGQFNPWWIVGGLSGLLLLLNMLCCCHYCCKPIAVPITQRKQKPQQQPQEYVVLGLANNMCEPC